MSEERDDRVEALIAQHADALRRWCGAELLGASEAELDDAVAQCVATALRKLPSAPDERARERLKAIAREVCGRMKKGRDDAHTLRSVLSRVQRGERDDPELARKLDVAFGKYVGWLRKKCGNELRGFPPADIEEAVQESLLTAWRRLPEYEAVGRFRNWLWGIALNVCRNVRKKGRDALTADGVLDPQSEEASALASMLDEERDELVRAAAEAALDAAAQELVELRYVHEYSYERIAELLDLTHPQVRGRLARAKDRLEPELRRRLAERGSSSS